MLVWFLTIAVLRNLGVVLGLGIIGLARSRLRHRRHPLLLGGALLVSTSSTTTSATSES
jgi:hypothetical protein